MGIVALVDDKKFWQKQVDKGSVLTVPNVSFSKASMIDCIRSDGLGLNVNYALSDAPSLRIPLEFVSPTPSKWLCETLVNIKPVWVLYNEKACRIIIDAIITEILLHEANNNLLGFCEVKNDWQGDGFAYTGDVDYMLGTSQIRSVETMDSFLLVVEAKKEWPDSALPQILCEAGCLRKND
jgi:hypothetical protein